MCSGAAEKAFRLRTRGACKSRAPGVISPSGPPAPKTMQTTMRTSFTYSLLLRSEAVLVFLICAGLPLVFIHSVGSNEQFSLVKRTAMEIMVCALAAARLLRWGLCGRRSEPAWPGITLLLLAAWLCASLAWTTQLSATLIALAYLLCLLALYYLCATHPDRGAMRAAVTAGVIIGGAAVAAYGIYDFFNPPAEPLFLNWGSRTASLFSDPNMFGIMMVFPLFAGIGAAVDAQRGRGVRIAAGTLAALCFAAMILSYSRSAWTAAAAGAILLCILSAAATEGALTQRLKPAGMILVALAALFVASMLLARTSAAEKRGFTLRARLSTVTIFFNKEARPRRMLWRSAQGMMRARPFTGYGPGAFPREYHPHQLAFRGPDGYGSDVEKESDHAYNDYLELGSETGWPGLALWLLFIGAALIKAARGAMRVGLVQAGAVAACAAFFLDGALFQYPLYSAAPAAAAMAWLGALNTPPAPESPPAPVRPIPGATVACALAAAALLALATLWIPLPLRAMALSNRADTLIRQGKVRQATSSAARAAKLQPQNDVVLFKYAQILIRRGNDNPFFYDQAEKLLKRCARLFPHGSFIYYETGRLYSIQGEYDKALKEYLRAEKLEHGDRFYIHRRIIDTLRAMKNPRGAIDIISKIAPLKKEHPNAQRYHLELGRLYLEAGREKDALFHLRLAEAGLTGDQLAAMQLQIAETFFAAGRFDETLKKLEPVIRHAQIGLSSYLDAGGRLHTEHVTEDKKQALLRHAASMALALFLSGRCHMQMEDLAPEELLDFFHRANRLQPGNQEFVFWGGAACEQTGDLNCAAGAWQQILEVNPGHTAARKNLNRVMNLLKEQQEMPLPPAEPRL